MDTSKQNQFGFCPEDVLTKPNKAGIRKINWDRLARKLRDTGFFTKEWVQAGPRDEDWLYIYSDEEGWERVTPDNLMTFVCSLGLEPWLSTSSKIENFQRMLQIDIKPTRLKSDDLWKTEEIYCKNGILDPETLKLRPYTKNDMVWGRMMADWNPEAVHPMADKLFEDIPDERDRIRVKAMLRTSLWNPSYGESIFMQFGDRQISSLVTTLWGNCVLGPKLYREFQAKNALDPNCYWWYYEYDKVFMAVCNDMPNKPVKDAYWVHQIAGKHRLMVRPRWYYYPIDNVRPRTMIVINQEYIPGKSRFSDLILSRGNIIDRRTLPSDVMKKGTETYIKEFMTCADDPNFRSRLLSIVINEFKAGDLYKHIKINTSKGEEEVISSKIIKTEDSEGAKEIREKMYTPWNLQQYNR